MTEPVDNNTQVPTPAPAPAPAPAPTPAPASAPASATAPAPKPEDIDSTVREMAILAKQNREMKARLEAMEAEKLAEQGKFKELYEQEKAARERELKDMRRKAAKAEIRSYAIAAGAIDPEVADLIPTRELKVDEETGEYINMRDLVEAHKAAKPHLYSGKSSSSTDGTSAPAAPISTGAGGTPPAGTPPIPKDISSLSREEYNKAKSQWLSSLRAGARR